MIVWHMCWCCVVLVLLMLIDGDVDADVDVAHGLVRYVCTSIKE